MKNLQKIQVLIGYSVVAFLVILIFCLACALVGEGNKSDWLTYPHAVGGAFYPHAVGGALIAMTVFWVLGWASQFLMVFLGKIPGKRVIQYILIGFNIALSVIILILAANEAGIYHAIEPSAYDSSVIHVMACLIIAFTFFTLPFDVWVATMFRFGELNFTETTTETTEHHPILPRLQAKKYAPLTIKVSNPNDKPDINQPNVPINPPQDNQLNGLNTPNTRISLVDKMRSNNPFKRRQTFTPGENTENIETVHPQIAEPTSLISEQPSDHEEPDGSFGHESAPDNFESEHFEHQESVHQDDSPEHKESLAIPTPNGGQKGAQRKPNRQNKGVKAGAKPVINPDQSQDQVEETSQNTTQHTPGVETPLTVEPIPRPSTTKTKETSIAPQSESPSQEDKKENTEIIQPQPQSNPTQSTSKPNDPEPQGKAKSGRKFDRTKEFEVTNLDDLDF